jgi:hypothetical protein
VCPCGTVPMASRSSPGWVVRSVRVILCRSDGPGPRAAGEQTRARGLHWPGALAQEVLLVCTLGYLEERPGPRDDDDSAKPLRVLRGDAISGQDD